jgi:sugar lactone lactonase YvrE
MHITLVLLCTLLAAGALAQPPLAYEVVARWPRLTPDIKMGPAMGVSVDAAGNIWVYNRGSHPVIQLDRSGKVLQAWKEDGAYTLHAKSAHGMRVAPDGSLWLVDREAQQVLKYTPEGDGRLIIGGFASRAGANDARYAFNRPTNVAFDRRGNVYVGDGYVNSRVVKYSPDGKYLLHWGKPGSGDGEFKLVHDVTLDAQDTVYVADRGNERIQIFDSSGRFAGKWGDIGVPWGIAYDRWRKVIWMCDGDNGRLVRLSMKGEILGALGSNGSAPGQFSQAHYLDVDAEGNVYVGETKNERVQKFAPKR